MNPDAEERDQPLRQFGAPYPTSGQYGEPHPAQRAGDSGSPRLRRPAGINERALGGGSLIYANVFMEPPEHVLVDPRWPSTCRKADLDPYYAVAKEVLGARPIPSMQDPGRNIVRTRLFQEVAQCLHRDSDLVDINVFFGNDFDHPLPIGQQAPNRFGALQTSCVYCGECAIGCNKHSKNTLHPNYI